MKCNIIDTHANHLVLSTNSAKKKKKEMGCHFVVENTLKAASNFSD